MPDNIIRFRADDELLSTLQSRADGMSTGETARRDLLAYYSYLAQEQWPETRKRLLQALIDLHHVAFDAVDSQGCHAHILAIDPDGSRRNVPIYGPAGLLASLVLMAERGLLEQGDLARYRDLEEARQRLILEPHRVMPLGESRDLLYAVEQLTQRLRRFVPERQD